MQPSKLRSYAMQIATILANIDSGVLALPEFQRGYVWNRNQIRGLFDSLYKGHPIGGLLVWVTGSESVTQRGEAELPLGMINLLLDGQQRITTVYSVARGTPPPFFDGNAAMFTGLRFHLENEEFSFYQPVKMRNDPHWIDVTAVLRNGPGAVVSKLDATVPQYGEHVQRVLRLLNVLQTDLHVAQITGSDMSLDVVVDIFNRVNSGGTKLSKGDLALSKICADWPEARQTMKDALDGWKQHGYDFSLDWLLRSVNTVLTGEARFQYLHNKTADQVQNALGRAEKAINFVLNMIGTRLGLDHNRALFGRFAIPVLVRYLDRRDGPPSIEEQDKLLFWFLQAGMWGRFTSSTETVIDRNLEILESAPDPVDGLLEDLRLWHGDLTVEPQHFSGWSRGARFYPVLYMLTRRSEARDLCYGWPLKVGLPGKMFQLHMHHIFPKSRLYKVGHSRPEVNALANFCFQTAECNLHLGNRLPEEYLPRVEAKNPGVLRSQWIPEDPQLWKIGNYPAFLDARRELLAADTNRILEELLHEDTHWLRPKGKPVPTETGIAIAPGGIADRDEGAEIDNLNDWVISQGLPSGKKEYEYTSPETGAPLAVFDLAWPDGLQTGLSSPVAVLLDEDTSTLSIAAGAGFRFFTTTDGFRVYVTTVINPSGAEPSRSDI